MPGAMDAIIVGAGPAGSTAAILLARAGWSVALVEKQGFPRRKVCGECLAASNLPLLDALGIGAAFAAAAGPELRSVALMRGDDCATAELPAASNATHRWGRALGRETLDTLLLDQARRVGAVVLQPWLVQSIEGRVGAWRCRIRGGPSGAGSSLRAPIVIAAHGSWEALPSERPRRRLARAPSDLFAFKANFRDSALQPGLLPVLAFDGGYGGMVVADGGITTLACCLRADRLDAIRRELPGVSAGDAVEALLRRECRGVRDALAGAQRQGDWLGAGPLDPGIRLRADDEVFRIGNAAGEAHPIIGEGMSMALQSAWLVCARLLGGQRRAAPGDAAWQREVAHAYAADWRRRFGLRLQLAAVFAHLAMRPATAAPLLAAARAWPGLLTLGGRFSGKISCAADLSTMPPTAPPIAQPIADPIADPKDST